MGRHPLRGRPIAAIYKELATSRAASGQAYIGEPPVAAWRVLERCWLESLSLEGNYARENRLWIALWASIGYISVIAPDGHTILRQWRVTAEGIHALRSYHKE